MEKMNNRSVKEEIIFVLNELGVTSNLFGYEYLKFGIEEHIKSGERIRGNAMNLYEKIAKNFNVKSSRVERCIRNAIERSFGRVGFNEKEKYFGGCINPNSGKVSNSEFISRVSEIVKINLGMYK